MARDTNERVKVDLGATLIRPRCHIDTRRLRDEASAVGDPKVIRVAGGPAERPIVVASRSKTVSGQRSASLSGRTHTLDPQQGDKDVEGFSSRVAADVAAENAQWVRGLTPEATDHDNTVARLYGILLKMAYTEARKKGARIQLAGPELDDIAHQVAADATLTVCRKINTFRGDCRFTTWVYKIVTFNVSSKVNRHAWQRACVSLDENVRTSWQVETAETPERFAEGCDLVRAIERIIREDLTERQQRAFGAIAIRGLPVSQVAKDMNSNPNAIYKMMFDARKKLREGLAVAGYLSAQP